MQPQNHALPIRGIFKTKLQAFGPSNPETLQSQNHRRSKIRLLVKGLQVVHGQLFIQRAETRDTLAIHAKLDELLRAEGRARSDLTTLDEREPEEIAEHRDQEKRAGLQ
jgi:hypothetical protein